jgi:hypothetical protein
MDAYLLGHPQRYQPVTIGFSDRMPLGDAPLRPEQAALGNRQ